MCPIEAYPCSADHNREDAGDVFSMVILPSTMVKLLYRTLVAQRDRQTHSADRQTAQTDSADRQTAQTDRQRRQTDRQTVRISDNVLCVCQRENFLNCVRLQFINCVLTRAQYNLLSHINVTYE